MQFFVLQAAKGVVLGGGGGGGSFGGKRVISGRRCL